MKIFNYFIIGLITFGVLCLGASLVNHQQHQIIVRPLEPPQHDVQSEAATKQYVAALDVARVFGRAPGCADTSPDLITAVAVEALQDGIDPRVFAATIAVESTCDPMAISKSGAIGLTQVTVRVWKKKFDFTKVNLFNQEQNLHAGGVILSEMIKQYGTANGLRHYNGMDTTSDAYDGGYVSKIVTLAERGK
jgi:soluble lytic murein transglycosylase-like protein